MVYNTISNSKPPHPKTLLRRYKGRGTVIAVFLFGATVTTQYGVEKDIKMSLNETVERF
jgi:hypothetical protein